MGDGRTPNAERGAPREGESAAPEGVREQGRKIELVDSVDCLVTLLGRRIDSKTVGVKDAAIKAGGRVEVSGPIIKHTYMSEWVGYCQKLVLDGSTFISRLCHPRSAASALHGSLPFCLPTREQVGTLGLSHKFDKRRAASLLHCLSVKGLGPPVWG